ncbi:hypothetical protein DRE_04538 [Drechslerella stenobrocha 248]|uniref:Uncharacterized protein n=1 Tax=Drechslerella stenobrocha 248 TaxID=1043628 RepID=W7IAQ7_9PEZI|nr:hypothetical protein DRE_04538 [Drechslerella stenobrocha 248]
MPINIIIDHTESVDGSSLVSSRDSSSYEHISSSSKYNRIPSQVPYNIPPVDYTDNEGDTYGSESDTWDDDDIEPSESASRPGARKPVSRASASRLGYPPPRSSYAPTHSQRDFSEYGTETTESDNEDFPPQQQTFRRPNAGGGQQPPPRALPPAHGAAWGRGAAPPYGHQRAPPPAGHAPPHLANTPSEVHMAVEGGPLWCNTGGMTTIMMNGLRMIMTRPLGLPNSGDDNKRSMPKLKLKLMLRLRPRLRRKPRLKRPTHMPRLKRPIRLGCETFTYGNR